MQKNSSVIMANKNNITSILKILPDKSGVYLFCDVNKNIIYVGKAKKIKKRVSSYFKKTISHPKLRVMVNKIFDIKFILADNEYEALLLENNLIKKYQPRYNVLLKDDKTYPWICIPNEDFPRIFSTRKTNNKNATYFGPYSSVKNMMSILEILRELYPFRTCNLNLNKESIAKKKYKPCLDYHLKKCKAPCVGLQTEEDYLNNIKQAICIIEGEIKEVIKNLELAMHAYSKTMEFEKAHEIKNKIDTLKNYQARSTIVNPKINNVDVFAIADDANSAFISYFKVMNGAIIHTQNLEIKKRLDETLEELLLLAIVDIRKNSNSQTTEIILPFNLPYSIANSKITVPKKGDKMKLLALTQRNALAYRHDRQMKKSILEGNRTNKNILEQMQQDLMLLAPPAYIECFDNSNIQGKHAVSAMVCFRNAKPSKKEYRHFLIKTQQQANDYASMQEVVYRRYSKLLNANQALPNMILIDGGKGQVSAVYTILKQLKIEDKVALFGIAERLEEIFRPNDPLPLYIDKKSATQYVLQHLRDEAHRFSITHHRKLRSKATFKTELTTIQTIGEATTQKLLKQFHTIEKIKQASIDDLTPIIGKSKATAVFNFYHSTL